MTNSQKSHNQWVLLKKYCHAFGHHWVSYVALLLSMDLLVQYIVIPLFRLITTVVLEAGKIPFVSYSNIVRIVTGHPVVVISLFVELLTFLLVVYGQFAIILIGIRLIYNNHFSWSRLVQETGTALGKIRPGSLLVLLGYFILVVPFADLAFRTPLLNKLKLPEFILDYLTRNNWLLTGTVMVELCLFFFGVRFLLTLPIMVYDGATTRQAIAKSWQATSKRNWLQLIRQLLVQFIASLLMAWVVNMVIYGCQLLWDKLPNAYIPAVFNLTVITFANQLISIWLNIMMVLWIVNFAKLLNYQPPVIPDELRWPDYLITVVLLVFAGTTIFNNQIYMGGKYLKTPVTVSHRGVADKNGVQNSLTALKRTHNADHPDYVEMDIHETKDRQFVVMHDENLKELTGVNKRPHQLTLKQLTHLRAKENGQSAPVVSLDRYLKTAEELHQRLIVEVKTTKYDSPTMLRHFNDQYGRRLCRDGDKVHSLDYGAVSELHKLNPRLNILYVQPYNFTYPNTKATGYNMEYSTLNQSFINEAHWQHKIVYAWTVNDPRVMKQLMYEHVDGVVTDRLPELKKAFREVNAKQSYADRILNYLDVIPDIQNIAK